MTNIHRTKIHVPLQTTTEFHDWGIIMAIIVVILILAVGLFIFSRKRELPVIQHQSGSFTSTVHNTTDREFSVETSSGVFNLSPNQNHTTTLGIHENVRMTSRLLDGTSQSFILQPTNAFENMYITDDGVGTESNTAPIVDLVNKSSTDVYFVLLSSEGARRFPVFVPSNSVVLRRSAVIVGHRFQVVPSNDDQNVLAEITVREIPSRIEFDGKNILVN